MLKRVTLIILTFIFTQCSLLQESAVSRFPASASDDCSTKVSRFFQKASELEEIVDFVLSHKTFNIVSVKNNTRFIQNAHNPKNGDFVFFHASNLNLKLLNDEILKNKDLSQATNIYFQRRLKNKVMQNELLRETIDLQYSDYKSLRLSFRVDDAAKRELIESTLVQAFEEARKETADKIYSLPLKGRLKRALAVFGDPHTWYGAGIGKTEMQANVAMRQSTYVETDEVIKSNVKFFRVEQVTLARELIRTENLRGELIDKFGHIENLFTKIDFNGESTLVLSPEVIDLYRKEIFTNNESYEKFAKKFNKFFNTNFDMKDLMLLQRYIAHANNFSPSVMQAETSYFNLSLGKFGLVSVDMGQKGAQGISETMAAMALGGKSMDDILGNVRRSYWDVDKSISHGRRLFMKKTATTNAERRAVLASGDEFIWFPDTILNQDEKQNLIKRLYNSEQKENYRIVFLPDKYAQSISVIPKNIRSEIIIQGEDLEKFIMVRLKEELNIFDAKKIIIAVDVVPTEKQVEFNLIVAGVKDRTVKNIISEALNVFFPKETPLKTGNIEFLP